MNPVVRKVVIDCDPGIDDAVALCLALGADELDVLAVTAVEGCVSAAQANRNLLGLLEYLDPPKRPRIGAASPAEGAPAVDTHYLHGDDGLGNAGLGASEFQHPHPSEKLICDLVRANPHQITFVALGPGTNLARALRRDPGIVPLLDRVVCMGGSVEGIGNVTPTAEFNVHFDPIAMRDIFRSRTTKTLIPLDVTRQVPLYLDLLDSLPDVTTRVGQLLRKLLPFAFRSYRRQLGQEGILLHDAVTLLSILEPDLFRTEELAGDVEVSGELSRGMTLFDRRPLAEWTPNMEVALGVQAREIRERLVVRLRRAAEMLMD